MHELRPRRSAQHAQVGRPALDLQIDATDAAVPVVVAQPHPQAATALRQRDEPKPHLASIR